MNPFRILLAATAMELAAAAALLAVLGVGGSRNGWLDVINAFAPLILALAAAAAVLGLMTLEGSARRVTLGLAAIGLVYGLALTLPEFVKRVELDAAARVGGGGAPLRVLSANVWGYNPTPQAAAAEIVRRDADVVLLQEADGTLQSQGDRLRALYPFAITCKGAGVEILLKSAVVAQGCGPITDGTRSLEFEWVQTLAPDGRAVTLVATHLNRPLPPDPQKSNRAALAAQIALLPRDDLVLGGDFNTAPWSFAGKATDRLLAPLQRRTFARFSWPARLDALNAPWSLPIIPIDQIYTGVNWRVTRVSNLRIPGSDHLATEITLQASVSHDPKPQGGDTGRLAGAPTSTSQH